jgi:hypothetical protein
VIIDHTKLACGHRPGRDLRLSNKALGMLTRVMEYTTEDRLSVDRIVAMLREVDEKAEGRFAILAAFKELEELGYVVRVRSRDDRGNWTVLTIVYGCHHAECKNLFGMDQGNAGKLGHIKPLADASDTTGKHRIPHARYPDQSEHPMSDSRFRRSHPGVETEGGKPKADNPTLVVTAQAQPENQSQKLAPRSEGRAAVSKADPVTQGDDDIWPEVAKIPA